MHERRWVAGASQKGGVANCFFSVEKLVSVFFFFYPSHLRPVARAGLAAPGRPLFSSSLPMQTTRPLRSSRPLRPRRAAAVAARAGPAGRPRLAVFVSGGGSNLRALHAATQDGRIEADVAVSEREGWVLWFDHLLPPPIIPPFLSLLPPPTQQVVVSDKPGCGGWTFAEQHGVPTLRFPPPKGEGGDVDAAAAAAAATLREEHGVRFVALAGYLKVSERG